MTAPVRREIPHGTRGRPGRKPEVNVTRLERLWRQGRTAKEIARTLRCSPCQVFYWRAKLGLPRHPNGPHTPKPYPKVTPLFVASCPTCGTRMGPAGHPRCREAA
jgi:hypothetical protein